MSCVKVGGDSEAMRDEDVEGCAGESKQLRVNPSAASRGPPRRASSRELPSTLDGTSREDEFGDVDGLKRSVALLSILVDGYTA